MIKIVLVGLALIGFVRIASSQNTTTSGDWSDPTVWSTGAVPLPSGTVNVNHPLTIDANLSPSATWTFSSNVSDPSGGTAYQFNPNAGTNTVTISSGIIASFEGTSTFNSGTIRIFGTLILGATSFNSDANLHIVVESGGTLIINGNLTNSNNSGSLTIDGALIINGNFDNQTGSVVVGGTGTIDATGTITSNGGSTVFGTNNDCTTGPCSGSTLNCTFTNTISPTSSTICSGSTAGTLTANTSASNPAYLWRSSTDNITYSDASGTNTNSTYVTPTLTGTIWYKVQISGTGPACTSTSAAVKVTVLSGAGWLGGTSSDWSNSANWCSGVPTNTSDVTISNSAGIFMPSINSGVAAVCRNLTINNTIPATSVTIAAAADASLSIYGNFTNNGTFTDNSTAAAAGVKFVGSSAQTVSGTSATVFKNLTIDNAAGVTISSNNVTAQSNLTMTNGNINANALTVSVGVSAASPGALSRAGGWIYGGNLTRYFSTTAISSGSQNGLFPLGISSDYRPLYFNSNNTAFATGGYLKVSHTGTVATSTAVSFADGGSTVVKRSDSYWTVVRSGITESSGTPFQLQAGGTGLGTVGNLSDLRLTLSGSVIGTAGTNTGNVSPNSNVLVERTALAGANLSNTFYIGSTDAAASPLPITLSDFRASLSKEGVDINWTTLTEENSDFFQVEKSINGVDFKTIAKIAAHGNSLNRIDYYFLDDNTNFSKAYYRLKNVDIDGAHTYSKVVSVEKQGFSNTGVLVYPNPTENRMLNVIVGDGSPVEGRIALCDLSGKPLSMETRENVQGEYQLSDTVPGGLYLLRVQTLNTRQMVKVIVR